MAYSDKEKSISGGSPYFLYEFNTNNSKVYYFAAHSESIFWDNKEWKPLPIKHGEVKQSTDMSKNSTSITIPLNTEFSQLFKGWTPENVVTVNIRRGHFGEPDTLIYWKGRVSSSKLKDFLLELQVESIFTSLRSSGVRARFQRNCRHSLYAKGCNVDKQEFVVNGKLESVNGLQLTIPEASSKADGWFDNGIITFPDGTLRMVLLHIGSIITIGREARYVADNFSEAGYGLSYGMLYGGIPVKLYPGCNKTISTCKNKFNNLDNQGGFKWIPSKNPMAGSSII